MTMFAYMKRLARERDGVAMVEFAFIAPILLLLILGGLELSNFALANMRVNQIAIAAADNSGRVHTAVDESDIYEVFAAAELLGDRIDFEENGRVIISSLKGNGKNGAQAGQEIVWQRCWGDYDVDPSYGVEGDGKDDDRFNNGIGRNGKKIRSNRDATMIFVEVTYDYQPLVGSNWINVDPIRAEAAFNVRTIRNEDLSNTSNLAVNSCD